MSLFPLVCVRSLILMVSHVPCNIVSIGILTCVVKFHGLHLGQSRAEYPGQPVVQGCS